MNNKCKQQVTGVNHAEVTSLLPLVENSIQFAKDRWKQQHQQPPASIEEDGDHSRHHSNAPIQPSTVLTVNEIAAIHLYTQESIVYKQLNLLLRQDDSSCNNNSSNSSSSNIHVPHDRRTLQLLWFPDLRLLLHALGKLPPLTHDAHSHRQHHQQQQQSLCWRGINQQLIDAYRAKKGETIIWWGFSSCSKSLSKTQYFLKQQQKQQQQLQHQVQHSRSFHSGSTSSNNNNNNNSSSSSSYTLFNIHTHSGVDISSYSACPHEDEILLLPGTVFIVKDCIDDPTNIVELKEIRA